MAMHYATATDKQLTPGEAAPLGAAATLRGFSRAMNEGISALTKDTRKSAPKFDDADPRAGRGPRLDCPWRRTKPDGTLDFSEVDRGTEAEIRMDDRRRIVTGLRVDARRLPPGPQRDEIETTAVQIELGGI